MTVVGKIILLKANFHCHNIYVDFLFTYLFYFNEKPEKKTLKRIINLCEHCGPVFFFFIHVYLKYLIILVNNKLK